MIAECGMVVMALSNIEMPPPKFDCRFEGNLAIIMVDVARMHDYCAGAPDAVQRIIACAIPLGEQCIIVLPHVEDGIVTLGEQERLRRHEEAHCRGWSHQ